MNPTQGYARFSGANLKWHPGSDPLLGTFGLESLTSCCSLQHLLLPSTSEFLRGDLWSHLLSLYLSSHGQLESGRNCSLPLFCIQVRFFTFSLGSTSPYRLFLGPGDLLPSFSSPCCYIPASRFRISERLNCCCLPLSFLPRSPPRTHFKLLPSCWCCPCLSLHMHMLASSDCPGRSVFCTCPPPQLIALGHWVRGGTWPRMLF